MVTTCSSKRATSNECHVAAMLDDLESPPGNRLKPLKGQMKGRYRVRVNDQYRVTFQWENGHACEVAVEDSH
jgi:proteic killer suppression protein